jgi:hypothetical protein
MTADDPYDNDAAGDKAPGHDRFSDNATRASGRPEDDIDAGSSAEALDRGKCFDDLRAHDRECRPASGSPDKAQLTEDGKWKWKGLELSAEQNRIADEEIAARQKAEGRDAEGNYGEGGLTPAMRRIEAELEHGSLVPDTEKFALKSPDRFKEKLARMILDESDKLPQERCREIHDGIRYTFLCETNFYSRTVIAACDQLRGQGYELFVLKNTWGNPEYKGINSRWHDPVNGVLFEVQFHTPESWLVKQQTHDAYEKINDLTIPIKERESLRSYQKEISEQLSAPEGWRDIEEYRMKGW